MFDSRSYEGVSSFSLTYFFAFVILIRLCGVIAVRRDGAGPLLLVRTYVDTKEVLHDKRGRVKQPIC